jgi:hypothetical protein
MITQRSRSETVRLLNNPNLEKWPINDDNIFAALIDVFIIENYNL